MTISRIRPINFHQCAGCDRVFGTPLDEMAPIACPYCRSGVIADV